MEISNIALQMLEHIERPGFLAHKGQILYVNSRAVQQGLSKDTSLSALLADNYAQYEAFTEGSLHLSVYIHCVAYAATVEKLEGFDLFLLQPTEDLGQLQTLALVAQQMRIPLSGLINALEDTHNPQANRSAQQLHRMVSNMSDAIRYTAERQPDLTVHDLRKVTDEIMESVIARLQNSDVTIRYTGLNTSLYCLIDTELLERAILNLISNAIKAHSTCIQLTLSKKEKSVHLCVRDNGDGVADHLRGQMFSRFQREPSLFDSSYGLGLGMVIVHCAAKAHKGAVLMEHLQPKGLQVTMTLAIMEGESMMQSTPFKFDYLGGMDHVTTELSDVLPYSMY